MKLSRVDLNLFVVFDAIYSRRNLTRAAELLCVTQPAVSNALARLRRTFDDPLFISTAQGMVPTPRAQHIIGPVRDALEALAMSVHAGGGFNPAQAKRVFRLSMTDLAEALLLPPLGEQLQREAPGITIESFHTPRDDLSDALATAMVDLAVDVPLRIDPQWCQAPLMRDEYVCLLRPDHPFRGDRLTLQDYLDLGHVHVSSRRRGLGHVDAYLHRNGLDRCIRMRVQHYRIAPLVVLETDWALTAPASLLHNVPGRVMALPFALEPLELDLFWHRNHDTDGASRWLRSALMSSMLRQVTPAGFSLAAA